MKLKMVTVSLIMLMGCDEERSTASADMADQTTSDAEWADVADTTLDIAQDTAELEDLGEPHPIGMEVPVFALEDLNPTSETYGQFVSSADLAGTPYGLIFLDSRCRECSTVADALWAEYEAHPTWWAAQPTFAVQRAAALEISSGTVDDVVDGNSLPYLADTEEINLWMAFRALNHDFFAISAEGELEVWLALYSWPDDFKDFTDHMIERYGW